MIIDAEQARKNTDLTVNARKYNLYKCIFDAITHDSIRCNSLVISDSVYKIFDEYQKSHTYYVPLHKQIHTGSSTECTVTYKDFLEYSKNVFESYGYKFTVLSNYGNSGCDVFQIEW